MELFNSLVEFAVDKGLSDIHITGGHAVVYRRQGQIVFDPKTVFSHSDVDRLVTELLSDRQMEMLRRKWSVDFAISTSRVRLRINVFRTTRGLSLAVRLLPGVIPTVESLNLHPSLKKLAYVPSGLVLFCGATGSGKTTTIAAVINEINRNRTVHVVTLEDPIEYRFSSQKAYIEQRELGSHVPSFEQGLIDVLREDPDVIVVGELREPETIRLTLNAAESGHLVIATLHASNVSDAIYRVVNSFPLEVQEFVRNQLSSALVSLINQQLVFMEKAGFRVPVLSILHSTPAVRGQIRDSKIHQMENLMLTSRNEGMFTHQQYLDEYLAQISQFVPPRKIFMPTVETTADIIYESPLFYQDTITMPPAAPGPAYNYNSAPLQSSADPYLTATIPVKDVAGPAPPPSLDEEVFGPTYQIQDDADDLDELVKQMNRKK